MVRIGKCYRERIVEYSRRVMKRDSMLFSIRFRLSRVPLKLHLSILYAALYIKNVKV
jgi:hypothetical protein